MGQLIPYPGFVAATYTSQSRQAAGERVVNWYPESIGAETRSGKNPLVYYGTPGLKNIGDTQGAGRGAYREQATGRSFFVSGSSLFELTTGDVLVNRGPIAGSGPVSITSNGLQLAIAGGGVVHCYQLGSNTITLPVNVAASQLAFIDGYGVALEPASQQFQISQPYDLNTWAALDFASVEGTPAHTLGMIADHRQIWFFAQDHAEIFYNSGNPDFPIERIGGAYVEQGIAAAFAVSQFDNSLAWLGSSPRGGAIAWRAEGYAAQRISTFGVEWFWSQYSRVDDAVSYSYQDKGHTFWVVSFPSGGDVYPDGSVGKGGATWVYDAATKMWHERGMWNYGSFNSAYSMHFGQFHLWDGSRHLVIGQQSGKIYEQNIDFLDDDGAPLRSMRSAPHVYESGKRIFYNALWLDMQFGVGLASGQGSNPQMAMRTSDDGGMTWSNERWTSIGKQGQYALRMGWRQCGQARDRCFEVSMSDPVQRCLIGAYLDLVEGQF